MQHADKNLMESVGEEWTPRHWAVEVLLMGKGSVHNEGAG